MAQLIIDKQAQGGSTMITVADKENSTRRLPPLSSSYTEFFTVPINYQTLLKVLFGPNCQHFTQVNNIKQTFKAMFQRNNGIVNKSQRANLIWEINCDARAFFGTISTSVDLHNGTGPKSSLDSIHDLIGANIALALQDVPYQIFSPNQRTI